jgi:sphingomyelin phosphodiesterase
LAGKYFARNVRGITVTHDPVKDGVRSQARQVLCAYSFGLCEFPPTPNVTIPFPSPEPENPKKFESEGREPLRFVQISDVHIDRGYIVCVLFYANIALTNRLFGIEARRRKQL